MQVFFTTRTKSPVLFEGWDIDNWGGLVLAMISCVVGSILIELIQVHLHQVYSKKTQSADDSRSKNTKRVMDFKDKSLRTFYHMSRTSLGYCLMLIVMTYNVWLYASVVLGAGIGYFLLHRQRLFSEENRNGGVPETNSEFPEEVLLNASVVNQDERIETSDDTPL